MMQPNGEPYVIARVQLMDGTIRELVSTSSPFYVWRTVGNTNG